MSYNNELQNNNAELQAILEMANDLPVAVSTAPQTLTDEEKAQARENIGALAESELQSAVDDALGQAKASGEFDGKDGVDGKNGSDGVGIKSVVQTTTSSLDGGSNVITVTKTDDTTSTFTVKNGREGSDGKDGYTPIKGVDYFDGKDGVDGKDGTDGKTPVKGVDYFTEADKAEIVAAVIESLGGNPIFGIVDENNNIIVNGDLPDGTYTVKYEMEGGKIINIGNLVLDSNVYYTVTKNLTNCTISNSATQAVQGGSYSATITANSGYELKTVSATMGGSAVSVSGGVINIASVTGNIVITAVAEEKQAAEPVTVDIALTDGIRIGSDGGDRTQTGYCATPHIDLTNIPKPCTIHLTKAKWLVFDGETNTMIRVYAKKTDGSSLVSDVAKESIGGNYFTIVDNSDIGNDVIVTITSDDVGYIRFSGQWTFAGASDSTNSFATANTKATLTYTPVA